MSQAVRQFVECARQQEPRVVENHPRVTFEGQSTFFKFCPVCMDQMPHVRRDDFSECVVCGNRSYAHAGSGAAPVLGGGGPAAAE